MDATTDVLYTVALCEFPGLPPAQRMAAEVRYCKALERVLGSAEGVARAYGSWCQAAQADEGEVSAGDMALAKTWVSAADAARRAGFSGLGEDEGAYFEMRLG